MNKSKQGYSSGRMKRYRRRRRILIIEIVLLILLAAVGFGYFYVQDKLGKITREELDKSKIEINEYVETNETLKGYKNIALFGVDSREGDLSRANSDAIIIASINNDTKDIKMVSVYRDTFLSIGGDLFRKANASYANGGAEWAVAMLNSNLDLDIDDYITIDFNGLAELVDLLDGVEIEVTDDEYVHLNNYCVETSKVTGKEYEPLPSGGTYNLNGVQATAYSRIRQVGNDYMRTERQRLVIEKIAEKLKSAGLTKLNSVMDTMFPMIKTSLTQGEMISLGMGILSYQIGETKGFPDTHVTGSSEGRGIGDDEIPVTLESNVISLHEFLFGETNYVPSARVKEISQEIMDITGISTM